MKEEFSTGILGQNRLYHNLETNQVGQSLSEVYNGNKISLSALKWFLHSGFIPGKATLFNGIETLPSGAKVLKEGSSIQIERKFVLEDLIVPEKHEGKTAKQLAKEAAYLINTEVEHSFKKSTNQVILPLTSGLDSRTILGALLECTEAKNLICFTWGIPNTYDWDVSVKMAKKLGITHYTYDLSKYKLTEERLFGFADMCDYAVPLFEHWPTEWAEDLAKQTNGALWMGLLGGSLSGSNLPRKKHSDPLLALSANNNRVSDNDNFVGEMLGEVLTKEDINVAIADISKISHDTIDFYCHHEKFIAPLKLHRNFQYVLPFASPELISFFLSLPMDYRKDRFLQRKILLAHYPNLAKFPSNRNAGLGLDVTGTKRKLVKGVLSVLKAWDKPEKRIKYFGMWSNCQSDKHFQVYCKSLFSSFIKRDILNNSKLELLGIKFFDSGFLGKSVENEFGAIISLEVMLQALKYQD